MTQPSLLVTLQTNGNISQTVQHMEQSYYGTPAGSHIRITKRSTSRHFSQRFLETVDNSLQLLYLVDHCAVKSLEETDKNHSQNHTKTPG